MDRQIDRLIRIKEELMKAEQRAVFLFISLVFGLWLLPEPARAADELQPQEGDVEVRNFTFQDGERLPLLRLHYTALADREQDAEQDLADEDAQQDSEQQDLTNDEDFSDDSYDA